MRTFLVGGTIIGGLLGLAGCTVYPVGYGYGYGYPAGGYGYGYASPAYGYGGYGYPPRGYGYGYSPGYAYAPQSGRALQATDYNPVTGAQTGGH